MFQDNTSQPAAHWDSSWRTSTAQSSTAVQTSEVLTNEAETQSRHLVECQCEAKEDIAVSPEYVEDTVDLHEFLLRVEPKVSACLKENLTSHAFDGRVNCTTCVLGSSAFVGYEVVWEELYDNVQCVYTLTDPAIDQVWNTFTVGGCIYINAYLQLQCTDVSWSSSGAMLVASYPLLHITAH